MTRNRLMTTATSSGHNGSGWTEADARNRCETLNIGDEKKDAWTITVWFYAAPSKDDQSRYEIHRLEGYEAEEVRKCANGVKIDYFGWEESRMRKHAGLVRYHLRMGMSAETFDAGNRSFRLGFVLNEFKSDPLWGQK